MLELGPSAAQLHKEILKSIDFNKIDKVYLYGEMMKNLAEISTDKAVSYFTDLDLLTESLSADLKPTDQVLFKGSNSMKLSEVVEKL